MNNANETNAENEGDSEMCMENGPEAWKNAERGKYYRLQLEALRQKVENSAELAPDVRAAFPTDEAVNAALRRLIGQNKEVAPQTNDAALPAAV